jgi:aminotransferase
LKHFKSASRLSKIKPSGIRRLFSLAQTMQDVIGLGLGEPDLVPPPHVLEAVKRALDLGKTHYTLTSGLPELREALAKKAKREYGLTYNPETEVLVTVGGTQAIFLALMALTNPGDEVLIPDPGFVCYQPSVLIASGIPVSMPLLEENGFRLNAEAVMSHVTEKSRIMIVNSPNNPTGAVFSYDDLSSLARLAVECDLIVISDEVYERITYEGVRHYCLASFPGMRERTLVVGSFSKTYAMTGFRVGYVLGPEELIAPMMLTHQFSVACVSGPAQYAAAAALEGPQDFVDDMVAEFDRRRRLLHKRLNEIEGFSCILPKGAFYVFANIKRLGMSSEELAEVLINEGKVVTVPGSAFGRYGEGYLRFSYATQYDKIEEALDRIERVVKNLKPKPCSV